MSGCLANYFGQLSVDPSSHAAMLRCALLEISPPDTHFLAWAAGPWIFRPAGQPAKAGIQPEAGPGPHNFVPSCQLPARRGALTRTCTLTPDTWNLLSRPSRELILMRGFLQLDERGRHYAAHYGQALRTAMIERVPGRMPVAVIGSVIKIDQIHR